MIEKHVTTGTVCGGVLSVLVLLSMCVFALPLLADDSGLVNPLADEFSAPVKKNKPVAKDRISRKGAVFTDSRIPATAIQQVAGSMPAAATPESIWDDPQINTGVPQTPMPFDNATIDTVNNYPANQPMAAAMPYYAANQNPAASMYQFASPFGMVNPYNVPQFGQGAPYGQMFYQQPQQQDPNTIYQVLLMQEMARRQAEETKTEDAEKKKAEEEQKAANDSWTSSKMMPVKVTSPLGETLLSGFRTMSLFNSPTGPDRGCGEPLVNKSWLDHPYSFGGFVGSVSGSKLTNNIKQHSGNTGGLIFSYNTSDYWGLESRVHFSSLDFKDTTEINRSNQLTVIDAAVQYYPLGNAKWRPYIKYGIGAGRETFTLADAANPAGKKYAETIVTMPMGIGMRYWWNERIAVQCDLFDNIIFSSDIAKAQNLWTFGVGFTYSFGENKKKRPVHYWPATPSLGSKW